MMILTQHPSQSLTPSDRASRLVHIYGPVVLAIRRNPLEQAFPKVLRYSCAKCAESNKPAVCAAVVAATPLAISLQVILNLFHNR
ncbi:MAG: hypothetical protein JWO52_4478 [Gammaproteobacteria bacterium]|nr:hypothetical protein [Gammaproteobacteria bacterium]